MGRKIKVTDAETGEQIEVDEDQLVQGPIRHRTLPDDLLERIRNVYYAINDLYGDTLEQFEIGFMRDMHPEDEVAIWCSITAAWIAYHEQHLGDELLPDEDEKQLIGALLAISAGVEDVEALGVPVDVGRRLLACYDGRSSS